jgi:5-methylcytosine-specific restriction endonuclease McrA
MEEKANGHDTPSPPEKTCCHCGRTFPATTDHFYPHKGGKWGVSTTCKECNTVIVRKNSYREELKDSREKFLKKIGDHSRLLQLMIEVLAESDKPT